MFRPSVGIVVVILVTALTIIAPSIASQGVSSKGLLSPRLIALQKEIQTGNRAALESFWQEIIQRGTPLIEPIPGDEKHVLVTFLWRGKADTRNVVILSGLTNTLWSFAKQDLAEDQMTPMSGIDVWHKTYRVPKDARFMYYLSPGDSLVSSEEVRDWTERTRTWQADPLNPNRLVRPHEGKEWVASVVELPNAPPQPWLKPLRVLPAGRVELHVINSKPLGGERRFWVYTPPHYAKNHSPYHLLVLFDGSEDAASKTAALLDYLIAKEGLPPLVAVIVEHKSRMVELGCHPPFNKFLTQELLPWVRRHHRVGSNPVRTVLAGGSLGGLAAAFAALQHPEVFGNVISQSGYFVFKGEDDDTEYGWLMRQYAASPKSSLRFYLAVGSWERGPYSLLMANRHMRDVLQAKGYPVDYREFSGSHDPVWSSNILADGLLALIGRDANKKK